MTAIIELTTSIGTALLQENGVLWSPSTRRLAQVHATLTRLLSTTHICIFSVGTMDTTRMIYTSTVLQLISGAKSAEKECGPRVDIAPRQQYLVNACTSSVVTMEQDSWMTSTSLALLAKIGLLLIFQACSSRHLVTLTYCWPTEIQFSYSEVVPVTLARIFINLKLMRTSGLPFSANRRVRNNKYKP